MLGLSLLELGRDEEAAALLEVALKSNSQDSSLLFGLGLAYLRLKRPEVKTMIDRLVCDRNRGAVCASSERSEIPRRIRLSTRRRVAGSRR